MEASHIKSNPRSGKLGMLNEDDDDNYDDDDDADDRRGKKGIQKDQISSE